MKGTPTTFWGKLRRDDPTGPVLEWHPLEHHCADVAACGSALLELPTWRTRLARLAGRSDLDETTRGRLSVLMALHDLGKLGLGFQAKGRPELGSKSGHVAEALGALGKPVFACLAPLTGWGDAATSLLVSSICHHGQPQDLRAPQPYENVWWT
jgi:CRISPR-associated endonuclease/helicase Cas3